MRSPSAAPQRQIEGRFLNGDCRPVGHLGRGWRRAKVLIQGGRCFPRYTAVRLSGAGLGVNPVKTGWIGLGLGIEIVSDDLRIVTAPVHTIRRRVRPASGLADRTAA